MKDLNSIMEFDHVIEVLPSGEIISRHDIIEPNLLDDELDSSKWELLDGYSGQYGYSGPIMHNSEFIGGRMADDIRSNPGVYVALVSYYSEDADGEDDGEGNVEGWAVAQLCDPDE